MADDPPLSAVEQEIFDVIAAADRLSTEEITEGVGNRSHVEILSGIRRLEQKGYIVDSGDETWSVNPEREV